jgi:hypothetical protein
LPAYKEIVQVVRDFPDSYKANAEKVIALGSLKVMMLIQMEDEILYLIE